MPAQIRPTRLDVTDRFPMVGFKIQSDGVAEVAIGVDPGLFSPEGKKNRTAANFFSTRGNGVLRFDKGEGGFTIPPEVLARFIGNERLYFGLATADEGGAMKVAVMPSPASPYISIKGLSGRSMARVRVLPNRQQRAAGYGRNGEAQLEWAGDTAQPGTTTVVNGGEAGTTPGGKPNGAAQPAPAPYDDGFGPMPDATTTNATPAAQGFSRQRARGLDYDDPEAHGIEGPAYTEAAALPTTQARGLSVPTPDYSRASRFAPSPAFTSGRSGQTVDRIVIHITDAPTTSSTVNHFTAPGAQASAHYLVGQDGEIVQFVAEADTAWHARGVNSHSVGIEHVAIKQGGVDYPRANGTKQHFDYLPPTDTQYCESAALVTYLCDKYGLTPDRTTIIGHREADARTSHTSCPDGAWNWDHFMDLVSNRYCTAQPAVDAAQGLSTRAATGDRYKASSRAMSTGAFTVNWDEVELIPQPTGNSCWAAAGAMLVGWRDLVSLTPDTVAATCSRSTASGLLTDDNARFAAEMGFIAVSPVCYTEEGFRSLLESNGPLWVSEGVPPNLHAIIVTGMYSDGTNTYVRIADPWDRAVGTPGQPGPYAPTHATGSRYIMNWDEFTRQYEAAMTGNPPNRQILHSGNPNGLTPNTGQTAPPPGYAQGYARRMPAARGLAGGQSFTINWDEVQQVAQPTDVSCWATAASMVLGWRDWMSLTVEGIAERAGLTTATGLDPAQVGQFAIDMGMTAEPPQSYTIDAFRELLANNGPLWVGAAVPGLHAIVVTGFYGDGAETYVRITDPWDRDIGAVGAPGAYLTSHATGSRYIMRWADFVAEYERAATDFAQVNLQILHCAGTHGHVANTGASTPPGYAMSADDGTSPSDSDVTMFPPPPPPPPRARAMSDTDTVVSIGGAPVETVRGSRGNLSWEIDQFHGPKHPGNVSPATGHAFSDAPTIRLDQWPVLETQGGATSAFFAIDWLYSGRSIRDVRISNTAVSVGATALVVRGQIMDDSTLYPPNGCASLMIRLTYRFQSRPGAEQTAVTEVRIYGDGTHEISSQWQQNALPALTQSASGRRLARAMSGGGRADAIAAAGIVIGAVQHNEGGVTWSLDAFNAVKHPNDVAPNPSPPFRDAVPITLGHQSRGWIDKIGADFQIDWQFNGTSVGNIRMKNVWRNDAILANLDIRGTVAHDNNVYDHRTNIVDILSDGTSLVLIPGFNGADNPANRRPCAAMRVTFDMSWDEQFSGTSKIQVELHLFGDGFYSHITREVQ